MKLFILAGALLASSYCAFAAPDAAPISAATHPALTDFPTSKAPYLGAYRWGAANANGGAKANIAYSRWINRPAVWAKISSRPKRGKTTSRAAAGNWANGATGNAPIRLGAA